MSRNKLPFTIFKRHIAEEVYEKAEKKTINCASKTKIVYLHTKKKKQKTA